MLKYIPVKKPSGDKLLNALLKQVLKRNPKGGSLCKLSLNPQSGRCRDLLHGEQGPGITAARSK
jgi:hypothetical protein